MVWFWPCPKTFVRVLQLREKGCCFASAIWNDSGGSTKGFRASPTPERRPKKVWFLFGGTENKAFLCSRFRKRGHKFNEVFQRWPPSQRVQGRGFRLAGRIPERYGLRFFLRVNLGKKGQKKFRKSLDCRNKNVYLCSRFERGESAGIRKFIEEI